MKYCKNSFVNAFEVDMLALSGFQAGFRVASSRTRPSELLGGVWTVACSCGQGTRKGLTAETVAMANAFLRGRAAAETHDLTVIGLGVCTGTGLRQTAAVSVRSTFRLQRAARVHHERAVRARRAPITRAVFAMLVVIVLSVPARAQPSAWRLDPIGGWGGPVNHVQVDGDIAYVGSGQRLVVLDISDESSPVEIGSIGLVTAVHDFVVRDDYAFVATTSRPHRFCVVDISDPTSMRVLWSATRSMVGQPREVDLLGNIAYVRGGPSSADLEAFDITNPESPVHLGRALIAAGGFGVEEAQIVGSLLYVAGDQSDDSRGRFDIYDLSGDPSAPALLSSLSSPFQTNGHVFQVVVEGSHAYVLLHDSGTERDLLWVIDVSDPTVPVAMGSVVVTERFVLGAVANDLAVRDQVVYVADWATESPTPGTWSRSRGLVIFDATDPTNPTFVGNIKTHGTVSGVRAAGDRLYMLDDGEGLLIADNTDRVNPAIIGNYYLPALLGRMAKDGDLLYVSDGWNGFTVLDVSDPRQIMVRGSYQTRNAGLGLDNLGIAVIDDRAYLAVGYDGFEIVDISDPSNPAFLGAFRLPNDLRRLPGLAVSSELVQGKVVALVGIEPFAGSTSIRAYDVTDPTAISEIGRLFLGASVPNKIKLAASQLDGHPIAFIGNAGLPYIIDVTDPANMQVDSNAGPTSTADFDEQTGLWCIASGQSNPDFGGLHIWNASDPTAPWELAYVRGISRSTAIEGSRVYVSDSQPSPTLDVYDMRDPAQPELLLSRRAATYTQLHAEEPFIYAISTRSTALGTPGDVGFVAFVSSCPADFTGSSNSNDPEYGVPNGVVDADDFFYFLDQFVADNTDVADLTGSGDPNDPGYGVPDGVIDADDFFFFLDLFVLGCP